MHCRYLLPICVHMTVSKMEMVFLFEGNMDFIVAHPFWSFFYVFDCQVVFWRWRMKDHLKFKVTKAMVYTANAVAYMVLAGLIVGATGVMIIGAKILWFGVTL